MKFFLTLSLTLLASFNASATPLSCDEAAKFRLPPAEMNNIGQELCGGLIGHTSSVAGHLLFAYTSQCFSRMNSELRKTQGADPKIIMVARQIDSILCDLPPFEGIVYRGVSLPDKVLKEYLKGPTVTMPAFTSTSMMHSIGCRYAGNVILHIRSKNGRDISDYSKFYDEAEVLFRLGTEFKVLNVTTDPDCKQAKYLIEMEEV